VNIYGQVFHLIVFWKSYIMSIVEYANKSRFFSPASFSEVVAVPIHSKLTLREATDFLGIPEPDLIELLDAGEIESRYIGNQRVVIADSLFNYDRETTRLQAEALDELTQQTQELGLN